METFILRQKSKFWFGMRFSTLRADGAVPLIATCQWRRQELGLHAESPGGGGWMSRGAVAHSCYATAL